VRLLESLERDDWNSDSSGPRRKRRRNQFTEKSRDIGDGGCSFPTRRDPERVTHSPCEKEETSAAAKWRIMSLVRKPSEPSSKSITNFAPSNPASQEPPLG